MFTQNILPDCGGGRGSDVCGGGGGGVGGGVDGGGGASG